MANISTASSRRRLFSLDFTLYRTSFHNRTSYSGPYRLNRTVGFCKVNRLSFSDAEIWSLSGPREIMTKKWIPPSPWLGRKVKQGFRGYPIATIAFYGPTAEIASKVVVGI